MDESSVGAGAPIGKDQVTSEAASHASPATTPAAPPIEMPRKIFRVVERIAAIAHEVNRGYCAAIGDPVPPCWPLAPAWMKRSAIAGVDAAILDPRRTPRESHEGWLVEKRANGWVYGAEKCSKARTHPCCVEYDALPRAQRVKDYLFLSVVRALSQELPDALPPMEPDPMSKIERDARAFSDPSDPYNQALMKAAVSASTRAGSEIAPSAGVDL